MRLADEFISFLFLVLIVSLLLTVKGHACIDCDLSGDTYPVNNVSLPTEIKEDKNTNIQMAKVNIDDIKVKPITDTIKDSDVVRSTVKDVFVQNGQYCFVEVVIKQQGDEIVKKEVMKCSETPEFESDKKDQIIEQLKKQIELEKARKPGYWELFADFYYRDDKAPLYCRKYARPDSWFKIPGTACLKPTGEWEIIK